nr:immunoglobulin light chain junction region [Macaca mulatta]
CQQGSSFPFTF